MRHKTLLAQQCQACMGQDNSPVQNQHASGQDGTQMRHKGLGMSALVPLSDAVHECEVHCRKSPGGF